MAAADGSFLLPVSVLTTKLPSGTHKASTYKSGNARLSYCNLSIFKMVAVRHVGFCKKVNFDYAGTSGTPFFICTRNLVQLCRSAAEICPEIEFKMAAADGSFLLPVSVLTTKLPSGTHRAFTYKMLSKSGNARLSYCNLSIFKMAAVRHLEFY